MVSLKSTLIEFQSLVFLAVGISDPHHHLNWQSPLALEQLINRAEVHTFLLSNIWNWDDAGASGCGATSCNMTGTMCRIVFLFAKSPFSPWQFMSSCLSVKVKKKLMGLPFQQRSELEPASSYTKSALDTCKMRFLFNRCHIIFKTKQKDSQRSLTVFFFLFPTPDQCSLRTLCCRKVREFRVSSADEARQGVSLCVYHTYSQIHKVQSLHFLCYIYSRGSHSGRRSAERDLLQIRTARMSNVIWNTNIINNRVWDNCVMKTHPQTNGDHNRLKAKMKKKTDLLSYFFAACFLKTVSTWFQKISLLFVLADDMNLC